MSKISERNSASQTESLLSRPLAALATDLYRKYKNDIFFSTRIQIILFHTFSVLVIAVVIVQLFEFSQKTTLAAVAQSLQELITTGSVNDNIITEAVSMVDSTKEYVLWMIIGLSVVFGIIAAYISLRPVREAVIVQRRFVSSVAHELRTPLAVLRINNEVAALEVSADDPVAETLANNIEEIDRITSILNNLLLLNRLTTLNDTALEMVNVADVVKLVTERLQKLAGSKGILLRADESITPSIYGNATALEQAVFNIVKNAIVYTKRGGEVKIHYPAITDAHVTLAISDNGIGIPKKDLAHIFEPFYRSSNTENRNGTGIGLAIVLEIIKLHNGKLQVESRSGAGTDFYVTLPRLPSGQPPPRSQNDGVTYDFTSDQS